MDFYRFNPDPNRSKVPIEDKLDNLIKIMKESIQRIEREQNTESLEIIRLYH